MRILVINVNRTGSTNLCQGLSKYFDLKYYPSPERDYILHQPKDIEFYKNNSNLLHKRTLNNTFEGLSEYCEVYSNIILLSRRNIQEAIESWSYITTKRDDPNVLFGSHTSRYVWEKTDNYDEVQEKLLEGESIVKKLSSTFNIPITYYEDIYYTNSKEIVESLNLGIDYEKFKKYLDTSKRQRQYLSNTTLI